MAGSRRQTFNLCQPWRIRALPPAVHSNVTSRSVSSLLPGKANIQAGEGGAVQVGKTIPQSWPKSLIAFSFKSGAAESATSGIAISVGCANTIGTTCQRSRVLQIKQKKTRKSFWRSFGIEGRIERNRSENRTCAQVVQDQREKAAAYFEQAEAREDNANARKRSKINNEKLHSSPQLFTCRQNMENVTIQEWAAKKNMRTTTTTCTCGAYTS